LRKDEYQYEHVLMYGLILISTASQQGFRKGIRVCASAQADY